MKVVLQDGIKDCGVCCLLSIVRHYRGNVSKEYLRELTYTTKNGVTAYNLIQAAKSLGFNSYALNGDIEQINANNLPVIAHVILNKSYKHFIVIYDINFLDKKILIMDPSKGKKTISFSEFKMQTSGNFIFLKPIKKIPVFQEKKIIKKTIIKYIKNEKKYFFFLIVLTFLFFLANVFSAFHFKYLIEFSIEYNVSNNVLLISYIVFFIYSVKNCSLYLRNILLMKYSTIFDEVITTKIYGQIILLPYLYYKNRTTGEVISRIKDLTVIKNFLVNVITTLSIDILSVAIFIIFMFNINKALTYISILFYSSIMILDILFKNKIKNKTNNYYRKEEKVNSCLIESLSSVDAIKGMHIEKRIIDKFMIKYRSYLDSIYSLSLVYENKNFLKNLINDIFYVIILALGTIYVIKRVITLSELIIFQSVLNFCMMSFKNLILIFAEYPKYKISRERIEDIFTIKEEKFIGASYYDKYKFTSNIKYINLNYSYGSKKLFNNINFTINKGDKIFLYGPSGTGKSTFVKLLMRYIEVPYGMIKIGSIDINHYHMDILRKNITYVSQQEFLFNDSLLNNITLNRNIEEETIEKVSKLTFVNEIGSLDELVEENGFNFSGGERQRIVLARSILKKSEIYIFDEALSQIDVNKERKILLNIFKYLKNKTIIVISHRFDNKDLFERKVKIEKGLVYEEKI